MSKWRRSSIDQIGEVKSGKRLPKGHSLGNNVTDYPYIRLVDVSGGRIRKDNLQYLSGDTRNLISRYIVNERDVCLAIVGHTIGMVFYVSSEWENVNLTENAARITNLGSEVDSRYLYYFLISPVGQMEILSRTVGSAQGKLPLYNIKSLEIPLPPLVEQKAIAHILGSLDDKIELNCQINETLEAMAQALFKSWFVDFDPVIDNALAAGNTIPDVFAERAKQRAAAVNDSSNYQHLFPAEFEFTEEKGWIPLGWDVKSVEEALLINPRITLKKGSTAKFADMKALPTAGYSINEVIFKEYSGGAKFQKGDVLFARITPCLENGKTGIAYFLDDEEVGFGSTEFIVMRGRGGIDTPFVACLARDENFRIHARQSMVGSSGRQRVQAACFSSYFLALPNGGGVLEQFHEMANPSFQKALKSSKESETLTKLRDTLLPKLLSGELRIPDAEKLVQEAML